MLKQLRAAAIALAAMAVAIAMPSDAVLANGGKDQLADPPAKTARTYANLDSRLDAIATAVEAGRRSAVAAARDAAISEGDKVAVLVHLAPRGNTGAQGVAAIAGASIRNTGPGYMEVLVPAGRLGALAQTPGIAFVEQLMPPRAALGDTVSQAVAVHNADAWHDAGHDGTGVKVGIIDLGFSGYANRMDDELPAIVEARCYTSVGEYSTNLNDCRGSKHGTAVAETVADIAPGAAFYIGRPVSTGDMQNIVDWMVDQSVNVINHSVGWMFDGPGDGTSPYTFSPLKTVDNAVEGDILFVTSAGNANGHTWKGAYADANDDGWLEFSDGDNTNAITLAAGDWVLLRWDDHWPTTGAETDLDLYLMKWNDQTNRYHNVAVSADVQSGWPSDSPREYLRAPRNGSYVVGIHHYSGAIEPDWIQLTAWSGGEFEHQTGGSIGNPAETANAGALAVGAAHWNSPASIESYSSRGPTMDNRTKPDLVGADCASTSQYSSFCGTSQASPHIAGLAALVLDANPDLDPSELAQYLKDNAVDRGDDGIDNTWGHGFVVLPDPDDGDDPTPTPTPTATAGPTATPTAVPTATPTAAPTATPTATPTAAPTAVPTATPTAAPTATPDPAPGAPAVTAISITSSPASGRTYRHGETVVWRFTFDRAVDVDADESITVNLDANGRLAAGYASGSGTTAVSFGFTVGAGHRDGSGIGLPAGTVTVSVNGTDHAVAHSALNRQTRHKVDGRPRLESLSITTDAGSDRTYHYGEHVEFTFVFDQPVAVDTDDALTVRLDGGHEYEAAYNRGNDTASIVFRYTVGQDHRDRSGIGVPAGTIAVTDANGTARTLNHDSLSGQRNHRIDGR